MFYIAQMADFHFGGVCTSPDSEKEILARMTKKIRSKVPENSTVVLCACGDYIDSRQIEVSPAKDGEPARYRPLTADEVRSRYEEARDTIMSAVIEPLRGTHNVLIGLCAGNHDITHEEEMLQFSKTVNGSEINQSYSLRLEEENTDLIFINSCPKGDHSHGEIDYVQLETLLEGLSPDSAKYFILHHALMNMDGEDRSSLRKVPQLVKLIEQYSVKAVLHGHTHGQYMIRVGAGGCPIVGVGTVYVRDYANVNSQFNLICCGSRGVRSAEHYQYHADLALNPASDGFQAISIPMSKEDNFFYGKTFSGVYEELVEKVRAESRLYHVQMYVKSSFEAFRADVTKRFGDLVELETLDKEYSYSQLAELWEAPELDEEVLYFNHGMYFSTGQYPCGIDYILHELNEKKTSSRAVLVTVNTKNISETAPDALLPSLLSIQAGFDREGTTLHLAMNLRALEASRFLKINICEMLYVAQRIYEKYPFANIEAEISAFRVQVIDRFGCFLKAKLDREGPREELPFMLAGWMHSEDEGEREERIKEIACLIRDKQQRSETVIQTEGVQTLLRSLITAKDRLLKNQKISKEEKEILGNKLDRMRTCVEELLNMLNQLKKRRETASEPTEDMNALKEDIHDQYELLLKAFEG